MNYSKIFVALLSFFILSTNDLHSQVIGGRDNSEMSPKIAEPTQLSGGGFVGDVNVMTGQYGASIPLGSVATPSGLSYSLSLDYTSSFSFSTNQPMTSGIPYGDGWSPSLPTISMESEAFHKFSCLDLQNDGGLDPLLSELNYSESNPTQYDAKDEGDAYWFAPSVNIPGVASGRAIFKYVDVQDDNCVVFVLNKFESSTTVEIRYYGNTWVVITPDGTRYEFSTHLVNYRAPSNQRVLYYNQAQLSQNSAQKNIANTGDYGPHAAEVQNVIEPKTTYSVFYCDRISNSLNKLQGIQFEYEKFGEFNYFEEFNQARYQGVRANVFQISTNTNYKAYTDILIKRVYSYVLEGPIDIIELDYKTLTPLTDNDVLLNPNQPDIERKDSLYNYTTVYSWDENGSASGSTQNFDQWWRYKHWAVADLHNGNPPPGGVNNSNPYVSTGLTPEQYHREHDNGSGALEFNHGFLESPRLFQSQRIHPGDIYEIKTIITRQDPHSIDIGNGTIDIALVSGDFNSATDESNSLPENNGGVIYKDEYDYTRNIEVFSTFNSALKWQMGYGEGVIETSNQFVMPNIPSTFNGFNIQIGPGNSDIDFGATPLQNSDLLVNALQTNERYNVLEAYPHSNQGRVLKSTENIPHNFGVGYPWAMMIPVFNEITLNGDNWVTGTSAQPDELYETWWKSDPAITQPNIPTKFDNTVELKKVELVRYSKNPYMLQGVKVYKVNGEYAGLDSPNTTGKQLVAQKRLEYTRKDEALIRNYHYSDGNQIKYENYNRAVILMTRIREIPVDVLDMYDDNYGLANAQDTSMILTTFLGYTKYLDAESAPLIYDHKRPYNGLNQYLLNTFIDHLGGITMVQYFPLSNNETLETASRIRNNYTWTECTNPGVTPSYGAISSYTAHAAVQYLGKNDEQDIFKDSPNPFNVSIIHKVWEYEYDLESIIFSPKQMFLPSFFSTNYLTRMEFAFGNVRVYSPYLETGDRNYTEYIHYGANDLGLTFDVNSINIEDYLFYGKLKSIRNYTENGVLHDEKLFNYAYTLAFVNGHERPNLLREQLGYDHLLARSYEYKDFYFDEELSIVITDPSSGGTITHSGESAYPYLSVPYLNGNFSDKEQPKFMEFYFYNWLTTVNPEFLFNSYFIKKTSEVNRVYENSLEKANSVSVDNPIEFEDKTNNPHGPGKINPRNNNHITDEPIKTTITTTKEQSIPFLIDESPLSDSVLFTLIETNGISSRSKCDILAYQLGCSNDVWKKIIDNLKSFSPNDLNKVIQSQSYFSDEIQLYLVDNADNTTDSKTFERILTKNQYLTNQVVSEMSKSTSTIPGEAYANVLEGESQFSDSILTVIINSDQLKNVNLSRTLENQYLSENHFLGILNQSKFKQEEITRLIEKSKTYPSDNVLLEIINRLPKFNVNAISRIIAAADREVGENVKNALAQKYNQKEISQISPKPVQANPLNKYCKNEIIEGRSFIETRTEFEYFEADYRGMSIGPAFEVLFGKRTSVEDPSPYPYVLSSAGYESLNSGATIGGLRLKHEPSWQVFAVKTSSPNQPGAFSRDEYFYLYDLQNRYDRYWYNYDLDNPDLVIDIFDLSCQDGSSIGVYDTLMYNLSWDPEYQGCIPSIPKYDGMEMTRKFGNKVIAFQKTISSKNARDKYPLIRSEYYQYDKRWRFDDLPNAAETVYFDEPCVTTNPSTGDPCEYVEECTDCQWIFYKPYMSIQELVPLFQCVWWIPGQGYFTCPMESVVSDLFPDAELIYCNDDALSGGQKYLLLGDALSQTLQLRDVTIQADTLDHSKNKEFETAKLDLKNEYIVEFYMGSVTSSDENGFSAPFHMIYPFDHLTVNTITERNRYYQPELTENQIGLQTKYYYNRSQTLWNVNLNNCPGDNFSSVNNTSIGLPVRICVGYNKLDSLSTAYEYNEIGQVAKLTDPSGKFMDYTFDGYHRLLTVKENGNRDLTEFEYHYWMHDKTKTFEERTNLNFVQTTTYNSNSVPGSTDFEIRKGFIDPLGRTQSVVSAYWDNNALQQIHSGSVDYDNWGRMTKSYKNFSESPVDNLIKASVNLNMPFAEQVYENDPKSRVLRASDFGVNVFSNNVVRTAYHITNNVYTSCELELNAQELELIMGPGTTVNYCFFRTELLDQDSKKSVEYINALGQKVATLRYNGTGGKIVTLFVYDSYGNLTEVINPEKQRSNYNYNILGQLTIEKTVDAGRKHYMYNKQGLVSAMLDEPGRIQMENGLHEPFYRTFVYDDYGRLSDVGRRSIIDQLDNGAGIDNSNASEVFDGVLYGPLQYETTFIGDAENVPTTLGSEMFYFDYLYSNASSQDWLITYKTLGVTPTGAVNSIISISNLYLSNELLPGTLEKKFTYGNDPIGDPLRVGKLFQTRSYDNHGLNIQKITYQYDANNNVSRQTIAFNADNDVDLNSGNLVSVIEYPDYNNRNALMEEIVDVNGDNIVDLHYFMTYDKLNRLKSISAAAGLASDVSMATKVVTYEYDDANGLVLKKTHQLDDNNVNKVVNEAIYTYDIRDRLTNITAGQMSKGLNPLMDYQLFYDEQIPYYLDGTTTEFADHHNNYNGNINGTVMKYNFTGSDVVTNVTDFEKPTLYGYEYDEINRLASADATVGDFILQTGNQQAIMNSYMIGDVSIGYDRIGNIQTLFRTLKNDDTGAGAPYTVADHYNYNYQVSSNRLLSVQDISNGFRQYTYDANGNVLTDSYRNITTTEYGRTAYAFNLEQLDDNNISSAIDYLYSADDQRCYKKVIETDENTSAVISTREDYYLMDATGKTIAILSKTDAGDNWEYYVSGMEREARLVPNGAQKPGSNTGNTAIRFDKGQATYFLYDHLGNMRITFTTEAFFGVEDIAVQNIETVTDYFPYGKVLREFKQMDERYLTTQHERDVETGLDYRGARYYDSDIGRFLSVDPLAVDYPAWSAYNYVMGNPIVFVDPTGKSAEDWINLGNRVFFDGMVTNDEQAKAKYGERAVHWDEGTRIYGTSGDYEYNFHDNGTVTDINGNQISLSSTVVTPGGKYITQYPINLGAGSISIGGNFTFIRGWSFELGVIYDFTSTQKILEFIHFGLYNPSHYYVNGGQTIGVDASIGVHAQYYSPKQMDFTVEKNLSGYGEDHNPAFHIVDVIYGGDSYNQDKGDWNSFHPIHHNYNNYGAGVSLGSPLGYTYSKGWTNITKRR